MGERSVSWISGVLPMQAFIARLYVKETKETLWSLATKGVAAVLFIALNAYLARKLGVDRWGSWSFTLSTLTIIFMLSYFGQNNATRAYTARYNSTSSLKAVLRSSLTIRIGLSIIFTILFLVVHRPLAAWFRRPDLEPVFLSAVPLVFFMGFLEYFKQVFMGLYRLKYHFWMNLIEFGLKIGLSVLLLNFTIRLESVVLAHWVAVLVAALFGFYFWRQFYRQEPTQSGESPTENNGEALPEVGIWNEDSDPPETDQERQFTGRILRYSLPLFFISVGFVIMTEIDTLMLGLLSSSYEVGIFSVGKQLANKLPQLALALSMGTMPVFARLNPGSMEAMRRKFNDILRLNALFFIPGGIGLILLAPVLIPFIFGKDYAAAVLPLQILSVWVVMTAFNIFLNALLDYQGRATRRAWNYLLTMVASIGLNLFLIPRFGAVGAASATTLAFLPYFFLNILEARKVFHSEVRISEKNRDSEY